MKMELLNEMRPVFAKRSSGKKLSSFGSCEDSALEDILLDEETISKQSAHFGVQKANESADIMIFIFHVTSRDHIIKGTCDLADGSPSP